jgi:SAM-dependent methyltransferase
MRSLYRQDYGTRYRLIADLIPNNSTVLDLCCGPGTLYKNYLRQKSVEYFGIDLNSRFVTQVKDLGAEGRVQNLHETMPLPAAQYVVMQASLYHFLPDAVPILKRMRDAATRALIISEPINNFAKSSVGVLRKISASLTDVGRGPETERFNESMLDHLFTAANCHPTKTSLICHGREKLVIVEIE